MKLGDLKGKKICLLGLGLENFSLGLYLAKKEIWATVLDRRRPEELGERHAKLKAIGLNFFCGSDYLNKTANFDIIFKTPGFSGKFKTKKGAIITTPTSLFFDLCPAKIIAVTGTKGKGTTASLIFHILKTAGKKTWLAGNIGKAPFDFIKKLKPNHFVVLELSSFQLLDFSKRPHIAVVTNLFPEHLAPADPLNPVFHSNLQEYYGAKANVFLCQIKSDWLIINKRSHHSPKLLKKTKSRKVYFSTYNFCGRKDYKYSPNLIGQHNKENIAAACAVTGILKIPKLVAGKAIKNFKGLEHHLEFVAEINNIEFYNDSASTMPQATLAAVKSFNKNVTLITGGVNKGYDLEEFAEQLTRLDQLDDIILIGQTAKELMRHLKKSKLRPNIKIETGNIGKITKKANSLTISGGTVLFSPGFASFDMFLNSKDRGKKFKEAVLSLRS